MQIQSLISPILVAAAIVCLTACTSPDTIPPIQAANPMGAELMKAVDNQQPSLYRFHPGDELSIGASRPELAVSLVRVDPSGYITYPYLGEVYVKDLTSPEIAERLAKGLRDGDYFRRVELRVNFVNARSQYVHVLGEVKKPGAVPITGAISVLNAIGVAEGMTYDAEPSTVLWIRGSMSPPGVVKLNLKAMRDSKSTTVIPNYEMIPGDVIYVPDSTIVSVQRFFNRMYDIFRGVIALENSIVLYDSAERVLSGRYPAQGAGQTVIITPSR